MAPNVPAAFEAHFAVPMRGGVLNALNNPLGTGSERLGEIEYEAFLAAGDPEFAWTLPDDEWDAIALNYTLGTTALPKGVVCTIAALI